jgi:hypothetical protein
MSLTAARIAELFKVTIQRTIPVNALDESAEPNMANALAAASALLAGKGDEPAEIHEMVDGFIVAGQKSAVLLGNEGAYKLLSQKPATTEDADETMIGAWKGKACASDVFAKAVKGLVGSPGQEGEMNFVKYTDKAGNMVGAVMKGTGDEDRYFIPVPKFESIDPSVAPAVREGVRQAIAFIKAAKTTEAAVALGKVSAHLANIPIPRKLKENAAGVKASLNEAADAVEENPAEAMALLHEAYMAIASDSSPYDPDAPFSVYGNSISFRPDTFISKTPDYSVANFVMSVAIKEVLGGPLGKQLATAVGKALAGSSKVKALDIELRELKESEEPAGTTTEALNEDDANTYSPEELRARIQVLHDYVNQTLTEKLGPDDDASPFIGGNRNSQYKDYIDCRFQLGQKLERSNDGTLGKWVTDPGHSQGAGTGTGDADNIKESVELNEHDSAEDAIAAAKAGASVHKAAHFVVRSKGAKPTFSVHKADAAKHVANKHIHAVVNPGGKLHTGDDAKSYHKTFFESVQEEAKLGTGARFKKLTKKLGNRKDVKNPKALAAFIGRKKYGAEKMGQLSHHEAAEFDATDAEIEEAIAELEGLTEAEKKGLFPGEGNGTVSPYAGRDDDGDEGNDGDGHDPDETVAVVIKGEKGMELRTGYEGQGSLLAKEDCDSDDDDKAKEALGRLAMKAQSLGYVYVPANMKEDHYIAMNMVLAPMLTTAEQINSCKVWIEAYEKAALDDDAGAALVAAEQIAKTAGKVIPEGLREGLSARAHKVGRRPLIKSRFKLTGFGKPKGKTGPGSMGTRATVPAGKKGINVGEAEDGSSGGDENDEADKVGKKGTERPGSGSSQVSRKGNEGSTFKAPSDPLVQAGPGANGDFSKNATGGPKGPGVNKPKGATLESFPIGEADDQEQAKAGDFVSYNGDPHVVNKLGIGKDGKQGSITPVKLEKTGEWSKTGPAMTVAASEMNFLKSGKVAESAVPPHCPECRGMEIKESGASMTCEDCGYIAGRAKFLVEIDSNQEGLPKFNTQSIKKPKTGGPQNLIPKGNAPPNDKTEGTSNDQQNLMCACPNCENTQDVTVSGKKVSCGNCGYTGTAADFQLPSTVGDKVEAWIEEIRAMSVDEFVDYIGGYATKSTTEEFKERIDAMVEAYKSGPNRKSMARKITAANPLVKRKLGKGVNLEAVQEAMEGKNIRFTFPKARVDEFLIAAREAGATTEGDVDMVEDSVNVILPREVGEKVRTLFSGTNITYEFVA